MSWFLLIFIKKDNCFAVDFIFVLHYNYIIFTNKFQVNFAQNIKLFVNKPKNLDYEMF